MNTVVESSWGNCPKMRAGSRDGKIIYIYAMLKDSEKDSEQKDWKP